MSDTLSGLRKRSMLHSPDFRRQHPAARAFLAPQRDRIAPVQHVKPQCGMCGGKVHTRRDFTAGGGWWLCSSCDTGPEVGMPRAA